MPHHFFVVRATVSAPAKRAAFDAWYAKEHMPDAVKTFGAEKAWRYCSVSDPAVHQATYQFPDKASLDRATNGEEMKRLIADFKSLRGGFKFNTNHYPIQDFYLVKVAKRADGKYETQIVKKVFEGYADSHAKDCAMK